MTYACQQRGFSMAVVCWCLLASAVHAGPRAVVDLDGVWNFATDPQDRGEAEKWYEPTVKLPAMPLPGYAPEAKGTIRVPGVWDNQGYGTETDKVRHNFVGKGWYQRTVDIPQEWAGRRVFLTIGGASRYAKVWVNGECLGEHIGFLSAFEYAVTDHVVPGQTATITIAVDSKQRWEVDALYGACSFTDYMEVAWGGIWGHVRLEARADVWMSDLFLQPDVAGSACTASAVLHRQGGVCDAVKLEVFDPSGQRVGEAITTLAADATSPEQAEQLVSVTTKIPHPQLWTPETPSLYTAKLSALHGADLLDTVESRWGMRQFTIDGYHLLLNGKRIMLRGYGDDHVYPEQMAMPSDKELHLRQLRLIKSFGFNHVRHHSTMMPPEYYDACDELGIICTAEFPIVYSRYLPGSGAHWREMVKPGTSPERANDTYRSEWSAALRRYRNHPSILCWVMGNELYGGIPLRADFQREANRLDPTRFFVDSDGVWGFDVSPALAACVPPGDSVNLLDPRNDRDTLGLYFLQVVDPITYAVVYPTGPPKKPIVVHEMGNYLTFSRPDILGHFQHNIKPFWLTAGQAKLQRLGLEEEAARWAEKSERLYACLHKHNVETVRKNPFLSGYHWWLFQDYWTTSNGLVDLYFRPKSITPEEVLQYNDEIALLQDGLERTYRGQSKLRVKPLVSNFAPDVLDGDTTWELRCGEKLLARKAIRFEVPQGDVRAADPMEVDLPDVLEPTQLKLVAVFERDGKRYTNEWSARLYPAAIQHRELSLPVFVSPEWREAYAGVAATAIPAQERLSERAVYITDSLSDPRLVDALDRGATVVLLGPAGELGPSRTVTFGTTWWKAGDSPERNHTGTFAYPHPLTQTTAPDGWCDEGWFELLEGGNKFVLDHAPSRPNIIVRALSSMVLVEEAALLFEVRVGKGCLIASGFNHRRAADRPENQWLLKQLLEYAATQPQPKASWPASFLTKPSSR